MEERSDTTFIYSGQGAQWKGMGVTAYENNCEFASTVKRIAKQFPAHAKALIGSFQSGENDSELFDGASLVVYQIAMTNALAKVGIVPTAVSGFSLGEIGAAYAAGMLTEGEAFEVAIHRTRIAMSYAPGGVMAVCGISEKQFCKIKKDLSITECYIACFNAPTVLTLAGPKGEMHVVENHVREMKCFWKHVDTKGKAYHSPTLRDCHSALTTDLARSLPETVATNRQPKKSIIFIPTSCSSASSINPPAYFSNSLVTPVLFHKAVSELPAGQVLEIGPSSGLLKIILKTREDLHVIPVVRRKSSKSEEIFRDLSGLLETGPRIALFFAGEGTHKEGMDVAVLKMAPLWFELERAFHAIMNENLQEFLIREAGTSVAPNSTLVTTAINMLHASLWMSWGFKPDAVIGHSSGDVAAAHAAGLYTTDEAVHAALALGQLGSKLEGGMVVTKMPEQAEYPFKNLHLAGVNVRIEGENVVTLCGLEDDINAFMKENEGTIRVSSKHPWHHPSYAERPLSELPGPSRKCKSSCDFVSAMGGFNGENLDKTYWRTWCCSPANIPEAFKTLKDKTQRSWVVIECGAHPIARRAAKRELKLLAHVASAVNDRKSVWEQLKCARSLLSEVGVLQERLGCVLKAAKLYKRTLDFKLTWDEQGVSSLEKVQLAKKLGAYFPRLEIADMFNYTSMDQLLNEWDKKSEKVDAPSRTSANVGSLAAGMVLGVAVHLPPNVLTEEDLWRALVDEQIAIDDNFGAARLTHWDSNTSGKKLGMSAAELKVTDPQHVLVLKLVDQLWNNSDQSLKNKMLSSQDRVGVYLGIWQTQPIKGPSVYSILGSSQCALASRIANTYNFQGPAITINTACSSSLVAVDAMMKDLRTNRIDYAIVGGVNLFGSNNEDIKANLRRAKFLSPTNRCHTFSSKADGYVRAEGAVCFLIERDDGCTPCRGLICGSYVNQNSQRKPITSVDPVAQARLIMSACKDAGVAMDMVNAIEMHGTGTRIGDPVEVSALASSVGTTISEKETSCFLTASKMHFGHLESAAGALGLAKALLMASNRQVPSYSVPFPNELVIKAMGSSRLALVAEGKYAALPIESVIGVSSFGFTGNNAHVIIRGLPEGRNLRVSLGRASDQQLTNKLSCQPLQIIDSKQISAQFDDGNSEYENDSTSPGIECHATAVSRVLSACVELGLDIDETNCDVNLSVLDMGLDSLGIAELSTMLNLDSVEDVLTNPTVAGIANLISGDIGQILRKEDESNCAVNKEIAREVSTHCCNSECCIDPVSTTIQLQRDFPTIESNCPQSEVSPGLGKKAEFMEAQWIRTTHVGSLPRRKSQTLDDVVAAQCRAGIDVINDGEFMRENYISDVVSRIDGLYYSQKLFTMPSASDMTEVTDYARRFSGVNGLITLNTKAPAKCGLACNSTPRYIGSATLKPVIMKLVAAAVKNGKGPESVFWSVPSPGTMALFCRNETYETYEGYVRGLGHALKSEYEAIIECGVTIQIDAPGFAMGRHTLHSSMTDDQFVDRVLRVNVDALNVALENIPDDRIRVHVCWGNYPGPHTHDIGAEHIWPHLLNLKARYLLIEMANGRHAGDIQVLRKFSSQLGNKVIVPGVIDTTSARVEHPMLIAKKLIELANIVGPQRVMAGTDCGFSSTSKSSAITGDLAWLKLKSMVEGAQIASRTLFNTNVPVASPYISQPRIARVLLCTTEAQLHVARTIYDNLLSQSDAVVFPYIVNTDSEKDIKSSYKWRIDWPLLCVSTSRFTDAVVKEICAQVNRNNCEVEVDGIQVTKQPAFPVYSSEIQKSLGVCVAEDLVKTIVSRTASINVFDKRILSSLGAPLKIEVGNKRKTCDVVVVGAGVLGLYAATRLAQSGKSVLVLEKRNVVGGIWTYYSNSTSQVNSSEGAYSFKDVLGEDSALRDHSSSSEVLTDIAKLAAGLGDKIVLGAQVMRICKNPYGGYQIYTKGEGGQFTTFESNGVILAINDRVGRPRKFNCAGMKTTGIQIVPGIADASTGVKWKGKRVVIYGYGAFAIEALRTTLEAGAEHVVIVARRRGCVCPKIIDYDNFINKFDDDFKHDIRTNAVQVQRWRRLYMASKATPPACWPSKVKPDGHTISVSDIFFIAHWMDKVTTKVGTVSSLSENAVILGSGERIEADIFVPCIGFERNTYLCEDLTGCQEVCETNYLDKHMMYLADAEIDDDAFNSFFGSSVLEYAKFFIEVFIQGLDREEEIGDMLWGKDVARSAITKRVWSQYIRATLRITKADEKINQIARNQIDRRTERMMKHLPPKAYEAANRQEWSDLHTFLNNGVPVPVEKQLPYFKDL